MIKIRDVPPLLVKQGTNWRAVVNDDNVNNILDWELHPIDVLTGLDLIAYSALLVCENNIVVPEIVIKELAEYEWWGDSVSYYNGHWLGPDFPHEFPEILHAYIANPRPDDPSFMEGADVESPAGFARWKHLLPEK